MPVSQVFNFQQLNPVFTMELIFCQKKILPPAAWWCQNKTPKFDLLTLLKI
jgi:hypothetical protein